MAGEGGGGRGQRTVLGKLICKLLGSGRVLCGAQEMGYGIKQCHVCKNVFGEFVCAYVTVIV